jgi:hypothetical protein
MEPLTMNCSLSQLQLLPLEREQKQDPMHDQKWAFEYD